MGLEISVRVLAIALCLIFVSCGESRSQSSEQTQPKQVQSIKPATSNPSNTKTPPTHTLRNDRKVLQKPQNLTDRDWRARLTPEQYRILRQKGTEPRGGPLLHEKRAGIYHCAGCGMPLYVSQHKFNSGTGWPSFTQALDSKVLWIPDHSHGMQRTEIVCAHCGGHLGHVFKDGPKPTGLRHCVNSVSLEFRPSGE